MRPGKGGASQLAVVVMTGMVGVGSGKTRWRRSLDVAGTVDGSTSCAGGGRAGVRQAGLWGSPGGGKSWSFLMGGGAR